MKKTGKIIELPLLPEVGNAIMIIFVTVVQNRKASRSFYGLLHHIMKSKHME